MAQSVKSATKQTVGTAPRTSTQSSIQPEDPSNSFAPIEVFPEEIIFKDIEVDQTYEVTVCVRNLAANVRRIRFTPPKTSKFIAHYETLGALAVGIATNVIISFETDQLGDFHDEVLIHSEGFKVVLPLHALRARPEIRFEPFVNLGFTIVGRPATGSVTFVNEGSVSGDVSLRYDKQSTSELTIIPETFSLTPKEEKSVALSYVSKEVNTFRCVLEVEVTGQEIVRHIDINANCVEQQLALVATSLEKVGDAEVGRNQMAMTTSLDFKTMYHGQRKAIEAYLVNVGPFPVKFHIKFVQGAEEEADSEAYFLLTPQELASQSIKRVIDANPLFGTVPPFSQLPISFICNSKKREATRGFAHNIMEDSNAKTEGGGQNTLESFADYFYTAVFMFADVEQKLTVQMQARAVLPNLKITNTSVHFYECPVNEQRDFLIKIENLNDELPLDFAFSQVAHFTLSPCKGILQPMQTKVIAITFKPGNLGVFECQSTLAILNGAYAIQLTLYGQSSTSGSKLRRPRGPESTTKDFTPQRKYISEDEVARNSQLQRSWMSDSSPMRAKTEGNKVVNEARERYTEFLRESRKQRLTATKHKKLAAMSQAVPHTFEEIEKDTDFCLSSAPIPTKLLMLPPPKDQLYVEKPLGKYDIANTSGQEYSHDPEKPVKNVLKRPIDRKRFEEIPFSVKPVKPLEIKECEYNLTPLDMHLISAGPKEINYDKMVIRAETSKWFTVVNDLKQHIFIELSTLSEEVHRIDPPSLVIPPGQKGGFRVILMSAKKQRIVTSVKYVINGKYEFNFRIVAEVEPAVLELALPDPSASNQTPLFLNFKFDDENLDQSLSKLVVVLNKCNAMTKFTWVASLESSFTVEPVEDTVDAMKQKTVSVKYTPAFGKTNEETLVMKVENGDSQSLSCRGEVTPAECFFTQKSIDFAMVSVGIRTDKTVTLKNNKPKYAIFHVKKCPEMIEITPMKGRIVGDGKFPVKITFLSMIEAEISEEIEVSIRGGKILKLAVHARSIIPQIYIQEPDIDFGGVTIGSQVTRRFTLVNESPIATVLYLNLEDYPEFEVSLPPTDGDAESAILMPATNDKDSPFYLKEEDEDLDDPQPDMDEDASKDEEETEEEEVHRKFKITVAPTRNVILQLKFSPKETEPYQFTIPFLLAGINQTVSGLQKTVNGEGLKPRFYVEKSVIDFEKKVISLNEKSFPVYRHPLISNPEIYPVKWRVDCSELDKNNIFSIKPADGVLEPGNFSHMHIGFNPTQPIVYEEHVNLYLDDNTDPYMAITFKGEGTVPRLNFDRREIVLPVVPLNIAAKTIFFVINDGYENLELEYKLVQDAVKIDLSLSFPEGKQLGVTRQRLPVEATFTSSKPLSFTSRMDFLDQNSNRFSITISGTADNSLLTAYPFIQRTADEIKFNIEDDGSVLLVQDVQSDSDMYSDRGSKPGIGHRTSGGSSVVSRSARSIIGFNPIPQAMLESSLEFLTRWMNHSILTTPINKLPDDIIENHGAQVYELVYVISGKTPPGQAKLQGVPAREQTKRLLAQYEALINYLKANGALLCTIRPEYLLSMSDFGRYLKSTPNLLQLKTRQIERRWPYLSMDAWVTLIYQIIRVFGLGRITPKSFKALPGLQGDAAGIEGWMTGSNIYSLPENILLKWMTLQFAAAYPMTSRKVRNFDTDLLDGTVIASVIQSYVGTTGSLTKIKFNAVNDEQKRSNAEKVLASLNENGMPTFLLLKDLSPSYISPREMVLFCITLFFGLPHYIPKTTIEFPCVLGERVTKNIELTNPSNKQVTYWVKLEGSSDFILEHPDEFSIGPKSTEQFPVHFQSRIFNSITAKLRLTSRVSESTARAAALVFQLVSKVHSRKSEKTVDGEAYLYEMASLDVEVKNIFNKDADFLVQLHYPEIDVPSPSPKKSSPSKSISKQPQSVDVPLVFPKPFYLKSDRIKIKRSSSSVFTVLFLPFDMTKQEANLVFVDENVGEMQYTIVGSVLPPRVDKQDKFEFKREVGSLAAIDLTVSSHNHLLENAKREAIARYQSAAKTKERDALKEILKNLGEEMTTFEVEINSPFFTGPPSITVINMGRGRGKGAAGSNLDMGPLTSQASIMDTTSQRQDEVTPAPAKAKEKDKPKKRGSISGSSITLTTATDTKNTLSLGFAPRQPGEYVCQVTLTNPLKTDIRALEVLVNVKPKKAKISLEMTTPARSLITQEIPVTNMSDKDWSVKTRLTQEGELFSASKDFQVRKKTIGHCVVTFKPEWVCEVVAKLEMDITTTGEVYEFEILGKCEEPRAEAHLVLPCRVKEKSVHTITVPNPHTYAVIYRVISDVSNATGDTTIEVPPASTKDYSLSLYPLQSGTYTGSITFTDPQGHFYWFTLEIQSATPEPEGIKELRTQCRKAVEFKITVYNPLKEESLFMVNVEGTGLYGDTLFIVPPMETCVYLLLYSPLMPAQGEGLVSFVSEKTGEFWYRLTLICDPADPIEKDLFECPLGKSIAKPILLENPSNKEVFLDYTSSNPLNFELIPDTLILPAYGSVEALVKYTPTSLKNVETGTIRLTSTTIGDWIFLVMGKGNPPAEMETIIVTAGIGESNSIQIPFKNPFREAVNVTITMETENRDSFQLLLKRAKFTVGPVGVLMVPVVFKPENMEELSALVLISTSDELTWRYPLRGITEHPSFKTDFVFRTKCRSKLEKTIDIVLPDLPPLPEEENFTHELAVQASEVSALVNRTFTIEPVKNILADASESLKYHIKFDPLRPFRTDAELFIYKASGGRWKFNVIIEAKEPDVDDTIVIEAPMGRVTSVVFHLANHFKQYAGFKAYFSEESDPCFAVNPNHGVLEPYGKTGTPFTITFTPSEYGAPKTAKLIVRTDEMQWSYAVKGTHPHYRPPDPSGGRLDNKLSKEVKDFVNTSQHLTRKNFIRDNIKNQKVSPKRSMSQLRP